MGSAQESLTARLRPWLDRLPADARERLGTAMLDAGSGVVSISCDGSAHHRGRIVDGRLTLLDHDVDAEIALLGFGGAVPACLLHLVAWDEAIGGGRFLGEWAEDVDGERMGRAGEEWHGNYWESWPTEPAAARVLFDAAAQRALATTIAERWTATAGPAGPGAAWANVRRAVALRARRSLVLSLATVRAHRRPDALVPVTVTVMPDGVASIAGRLSTAGSSVELRLPASWLTDVWATSASSIVDGAFVLARSPHSQHVVRWKTTGGPAREHIAVVDEVPSKDPSG